MDQSSLRSVQLDQERVTPTGLQFQDKKEHYDGMHIVHGLEPLFTVLLLFTQKKDTPTHFLSQSVKQSSLLVYTLFGYPFYMFNKFKRDIPDRIL